MKDKREPSFQRADVESHWNKNRAEDRKSGCMSDLLGKPDVQADWHDYRKLAYRAAKEAWLIYYCQYKSEGNCRHWFDDRLVRVIAKASSNKFITCYHWHKFRSNSFSGHETTMTMLVTERKLALARDTRVLKDSELIEVEANDLNGFEQGLFVYTEERK